jgi:hypothetical protein
LKIQSFVKKKIVNQILKRYKILFKKENKKYVIFLIFIENKIFWSKKIKILILKSKYFGQEKLKLKSFSQNNLIEM